MKGLELPINVLIIVAVAIIVLIAIVAMFYPAFSSSSNTVNSDVAKNTACQIMIDRRCEVETRLITIGNFDADRDGTMGTDAGSTWSWSPLSTCVNTANTGASNDNLASLCACYYSLNSEESCKGLCGC